MLIKEILLSTTSPLNEELILQEGLKDSISKIGKKIVNFSKNQISRILNSIKRYLKIDVKQLTKKSLIVLLSSIIAFSSALPTSIPVGYNIDTMPFAVPKAYASDIRQCEPEHLKIIGSPIERQYTCDAYKSVVNYFKDLEFEFEEKPLTVKFEDIVYIDWINSETGESSGLVEVSGYYNGATSEIYMTSFHSNRENRFPFRLPWTKEIVYSILQHELIHYATDRILDGNLSDEMSPMRSECIAYHVQFEIMNSDLKSQIEKVYGDVPPMNLPWEVNPMSYLADPDEFAYKCHKTFQAPENENLLSDILKGQSPIFIGDVNL